jgi:hypothetical protein
MKVLCKKGSNNLYSSLANVTKNKFYEIIDIRRWNNGYTQYLIKDDYGNENWFSKSRFSNRKEKLEQINEKSGL